jgi:large subunit ribosomal protein L18
MPRSRQQAQQLLRRKLRTRATLAEHQLLPRLSVHRSLRSIYAQVIDDRTGTVLASVNDRTLASKGTKTERAREVGTEIAKKALDKKINAVRFDRGAFRYHGRIAAVAEAARAAGLTL